MLVELDHPVAGRLRQARPAAQFSRTVPDLNHGAPLLGEHTEEVLREAGYDQAEIDALLADGAAKADVKG